MQRTHRFQLFVGVFAAALALCCTANAKPAQDITVTPSLSSLTITPTLTLQDQALLESAHRNRLPLSPFAFATLRQRGAQSPELSLDTRSTAREHIDFGRIGHVALISREVDQYGRIRGVNFLTYEDAAQRWNMKLNVKHGAMLQITRRWGSGPRPLSYREISNLTADNR